MHDVFVPMAAGRASVASSLTVYADRRWPPETGIGRVQTELELRLPIDMQVVDLAVAGKIGSPLSVLSVSKALWRVQPERGRVFFSAGFVPPLNLSLPSVVMVHDLTHRHFYGAAKRAYYDLIFRPLYHRCGAIVCVSEFVRQEFLDWSGMEDDRVHVVYNGVSAGFARHGARHAPGYDYVFYCGNHRGYKNVASLIRAHAASELPRRGIRLVITGRPDPGLAAVAEEVGIADLVVFAGRVSDADLPAYYRGARAIAYVSLFEGFGLPIIEGFASGVPVLTSNVSSMPEIAGGAAVIVDPTQIASIAEGLNRIVSDTDLRRRLVADGLSRLEHFDWDRSADRLWSIVRDVARTYARENYGS
ncbi:glycosyltransferase family 4 protein [Devosia nitrariae]|nr:glycosyltransferase family 1 protein [Devosia nitrariae]